MIKLPAAPGPKRLEQPSWESPLSLSAENQQLPCQSGERCILAVLLNRNF